MKNQITAKIIADSKNEKGGRLTTFIITMPRIILAEFNTHRMFSRNSASSRAIPFEKMCAMVENSPFIPIAWQKEHKGMQGSQYITDPNHLQNIEADWLEARDAAVLHAKRLNKGFYDTKEDQVTKQICNRLLEPFMYHTVIVTASGWENFFNLRCPQYAVSDGLGFYQEFRSKKEALPVLEKVLGESDFNNTEDYLQWALINQGMAEIHIMDLAEKMYDVLNESTPKELKNGEWHIPFGDNINLPDTIPIEAGISLEEGVMLRKAKIATARCARVSYTTVGEEDKPFNFDKDIELHDRLLESGHFSPFEHCAKAWHYSSGNFTDGWYQYRHILNEVKCESNGCENCKGECCGPGVECDNCK